MKLFSSKRKMAMVGLSVGVIAGASGLAAAYFTSPGSGAGSAQVGSQSDLVINQLGTPAYNSTLTDPSQYQWSYAYIATQANDFGNDVTLANGGGVVSNVVVAMTNFSPTSNTGPIAITLSLYAPGTGEPGDGVQPGALLGSKTVTVTPPSTAAGANSNTGAGAQNFNVTFNFTSQNINTEPYGANGGQLVYGISYDDSVIDTGLNVQLAYAQNQAGGEVVGTDTYPGYLFVSTSGGDGATGGPNGEITCSDVSSTFAQYNTVSGGSPAGSCGLAATPGNNLVPAVEIYTNGMSDLVPGGPQQLVNFSVTNPGNTPATVQTVTVSVATDGSNGYAEDVNGNDIAGCYANWFVINPGNQATGTSYTLTLNQTIPAGGTIDVEGQAAIAMLNPNQNQDACEGAGLGLTFTSN